MRECAVAAKETANGNKRLVAYVVRHEPGSINGELRGFLRQRLPEYMVPDAFVALDSLPLTASGKINRQTLLSLENGEPHEPKNRTAQFAGSSTHAEKLLLSGRTCSRVGRSGERPSSKRADIALAVDCLRRSAIRQALPLATLFQAPTIAGLAAILNRVK